MSIQVLIIEDESLIRWSLRQKFEERGYAVTEADSGTAGLEAFDPDMFDLIMLDYRLPDMNAPVVLEHIARQERLQSIPVLVLSQAGWADDARAATAAGARLFRVKPSRVQALRDVIVSFWKEHAQCHHQQSS